MTDNRTHTENQTNEKDLPSETLGMEGYKKTKLGWIPDEWKLEKMGELFEFRNGVNASKEDYGQGIKFVNVRDVLENTFITEEKILGSVQLTEKKIKKNLVKKGDVLFNRTSETQDEIGLTALYYDDEKAVFGGFVIRGRPKNNLLNHKFNGYSFHSELVRKQIISKGQGAVRVNIGQSDLEKVLLPIPPLPEQKKIADILSTWGRTISTFRQLIEAKECYKKGLMQQLLSGKKRFPEFEEEPWVEVKLGDVFKERKETGYEDYDLLAITTENGVVDRETLDRRDTSSDTKDHYKRILPDDIGYNTMRMWQGVSGYSELKGIISPAYTIVIPKAEKADGRFMSYLFKYPPVVDLFRRYSQGLVDDTLNLKFKNFAEIKVSVPKTLNEQKKIAQVLLSIDREIELLNMQKDTFNKQKKGLLQKLLTGKIRVNKKIETSRA